MTHTAKKQKNRAYYLKNRERILDKARARNGERGNNRLSIAPEIALSNISDAVALAESGLQSDSGEDHRYLRGFTYEYSEQFQPGDFQMGKNVNVVKLMAGKPEISDPARMQSESKVDARFESKSPSVIGKIFQLSPFLLRFFLVVGLNLLLTEMQVVFYQEHDILPQFSIPLAIASELSFISLVTMKLKRHLEWIRVVIFLIFYGYFVSALSFHVFSNARSTAASISSAAGNVGSQSELEKQLAEARNSLKIAAKGRSWKNMEIFGTEVSKLEGIVRDLPRVRVLGTSIDQVLGAQVILLVMLRALLMAAEVLNAVRLREQWAELAGCNAPVTPMA